MNKIVGLTLLAACGCALLSGCGSAGNTNKLKSMAVRYVKEKYGFKAKTKRVSNDGISWLTPIWEKSKAGIVEMTHDGKTFYVHADLNSGVDGCTDNYMEDEFCERIAAPFKDIQCAEKEITVAYTEGQYKHLVGKDVMTFDDLIEDERIPGIFVYIHTHGLNPASVSSIDLTDLPWISTVNVYDWTDPSVLRSENKPVGTPYSEQFILKCYAEYNVDPTRYGASFENYEKGKFTLKCYKQQELSDIHVTCGDSDDIVLSEYPGSPASEHAGTTDWYQIANEGTTDVTGIIGFPYTLADHDKKNAYLERLNGEKTNVTLMGSNGSQDFGEKYYYCRYTLKAGETMVCRMMTEDK